MLKRHVIPEEIREFISYNPETGVFTKTKNSSGRVGRGQKAPYELNVRDSMGYLIVSFKGRRYIASRVAYFLMTGKQPNVMDHINGITTDDRWSNLRNTDASGNMSNRDIHRNGKPLGVSYDKSRGLWRARLPRRNGRTKHLGHADTIEGAVRLVEKAMKSLRN